MLVLPSKRFLLLFGESLPSSRLPNVSRKVWGQTSVRFVSQVNPGNEPISLASLGFKSDFEKTNKNKENKIKRLDVSNEAPKSKLRGVGSNSIKAFKAVGVKKSLEIESAPFAAKSFSELGLPPLLLERLDVAGFTVPTDVQSAAVPMILKDHVVVIQSYTGSGKTLAYLLPKLSEVRPLKKRSPNGEDESGEKREIDDVIVAPSRELGMQIVREVEKLLGPEDKKVVQQLVGGANRSRQEEALKKNKPAIVVGSPGRIADISAAGKLHTHSCRDQVLTPVAQLLTRSWGSDPRLVQAKKVMPLEYVAPSGPVNILKPTSGSDSMIAFMNHTKLLKDAVFKLEARGIVAAELHGDLGKLARSTTLKKFRNGEVRILVTNELSARGLDVAECDLVVNLDLPTDSIHYAHRAGRTGRLGRKGTVVTICEEPEVFVVKKL
ncbi:hypothetical protein F3Y22_tig00110319pilonHSYRG00502 [Hibiscus syriacus]|uniref:RNA helicase n=1 Tax=Hibiscus syriacus TaxID=106335 RepID=A0A6A3B3Q8_HIBSY|nr:hypothetical protein F3Y22_tig00110319pilonHSYRG00502 [Hibiscus syriacus]